MRKLSLPWITITVGLLKESANMKLKDLKPKTEFIWGGILFKRSTQVHHVTDKENTGSDYDLFACKIVANGCTVNIIGEVPVIIVK